LHHKLTHQIVMAKRLHDTEIWEQDWFMDLPINYKLFFLYIKDKCDHSGIWRYNKSYFEAISSTKINTTDFLETINKDQIRIIDTKNNRWLLVAFCLFQYGSTIELKSPIHRGALKQLIFNNIDFSNLKGIKEIVWYEKLQSNDIQLFTSKGFINSFKGVLKGFPKGMERDKDKDKDIYKDNTTIQEYITNHEDNLKGGMGGNGVTKSFDWDKVKVDFISDEGFAEGLAMRNRIEITDIKRYMDNFIFFVEHSELKDELSKTKKYFQNKLPYLIQFEKKNGVITEKNSESWMKQLI
jgi:hypothetical protein